MVWLWMWGIITAFSLVVEFLKANLIMIWFAAGGLVTLLVVALVPSLSLIWQFVIFSIVSIGLLLSTRKICLKLLHEDNIKTNMDEVVGLKFVVGEIKDGYTYHKFNGVLWRVYAIEGEVLERGAKFEICEVKGSKLIAKKIDIKELVKDKYKK